MQTFTQQHFFTLFVIAVLIAELLQISWNNPRSRLILFLFVWEERPMREEDICTYVLFEL